jgi:hypothetical protein
MGLDNTRDAPVSRQLEESEKKRWSIMNKTTIDAEEFDRMFDEGDMEYLNYVDFDKIFDEGEEDILQYCDLDNIRRPGLEQQKVSISLPKWMISSLDKEAARIGVTKQAVIKLWINEKIEALSV